MIQRGAGPAVAADALDFWGVVSRWCPRSPRTPLLGPQLRPTHLTSGAAVAADALHFRGSRAESPRPPGGGAGACSLIVLETPDRFGDEDSALTRPGERTWPAKVWEKHVRIVHIFPHLGKTRPNSTYFPHVGKTRPNSTYFSQALGGGFRQERPPKLPCESLPSSPVSLSQAPASVSLKLPCDSLPSSLVSSPQGPLRVRPKFPCESPPGSFVSLAQVPL